jgi:hypothetical protein
MFDRISLVVVLTVGLVFCRIPAGFCVGSNDLKIQPPSLGIGLFFSGTEVNLSGSIASDRDLMIEIIGPRKKSKFNMKGRVGPFWMNYAKVELDHAPFLYIVLLPGDSRWTERAAAQGLGVQNLAEEVTISPASLDHNLIFQRFVRLKSSEQLYVEVKNAVDYLPVDDDRKHFDAKFFLPSATVAGRYEIVANQIAHDRIEEKSVYDFQVEEVGIIKSIHEIAYQRELLYGILSVVIALFVGAVMGLLFKQSRGH